METQDKVIYLKVEARVDSENNELCGQTCPHLTLKGPNSEVKDACLHFKQGGPHVKFYRPLKLHADGKRALRCSPCITDGG